MLYYLLIQKNYLQLKTLFIHVQLLHITITITDGFCLAVKSYAKFPRANLELLETAAESF